MNMPNNYANTQIGGDYTPPALGGHHLIIKKVEETKSKNGKDMIKVFFDFAKNDVQPDFMTNEYKNDIRPDKKWPHAGTQYILTEGNDGNCSKSFKSFITAFEKSNGCQAIWGEKFADQFNNKKVGAIFGEVENEYNGKVTMRHELRWFCEDNKADDAAVPAPKYLNNNAPKNAAAASAADEFINIPDGVDEETPFGD